MFIMNPWNLNVIRRWRVWYYVIPCGRLEGWRCQFLKSLSDSWQAGAGDQTVAGLCEGKLFSGSHSLSLSHCVRPRSQPAPSDPPPPHHPPSHRLHLRWRPGPGPTRPHSLQAGSEGKVHFIRKKCGLSTNFRTSNSTLSGLD